MINEIDYSHFTQQHEQGRMRTAAFGFEVEAFADTLIGRYLIGRAEAERSAALEQLATPRRASICRG
jgi:hypothetical protein